MRTSYILLTCLTLATTARAQLRTIDIAAENSSIAPKTMEWEVDVPPFGVEHQVRLSLEVRIDWPKLSGSNPWMRATVNGNVIVGDELLNKTNEFKLNNGVDLLWFNNGNRWRVPYSPDFELAATAKNNAYGIAKKDEPYRYVWEITRYVRPGKNKIALEHLHVLVKPSTMVIRNVKLEVGKPIQKVTSGRVTPAPTGPVRRYVAKGKQRLPIRVSASNDGALQLVVRGKTIDVATRISLPGGKWQTPNSETPLHAVGQENELSWKAGDCSLSRRITVREDHVHIADTLTNTGGELLPVLVEHREKGALAPKTVLLAGRPAFGAGASVKDPTNPSTFASWDDFGLGIVAEDDIFRVHCRNFAGADGFGIAEDHLGLKGGKTVVLEWSIYPTPSGDYWDFVNVVRRNWDTNFEIPGPFIFMGHFKPDQPASYYVKWMRDRDAKMVCGGIASYPSGKYAHGTGIVHAPKWIAKERHWTRAMTGAAGDLVPLAYFHSLCSTAPDGETLYADSKLIDGKGEHLMYPYRYPLPLYAPTKENAYGKAIWAYVNTLIDDIGVRGIYWDEMSYSVIRWAYGDTWDECSVMIDPKTHRVSRKLASVELLMQPLQLDIINYIRDKGLFLMANTQPHTRTMTRQKIVRFVETGTYSALTRTHLGCPLGLGNHHAEETPADSARHVREMLMYGGLYYGHYYYHDPAPWNFTSVMYPITPVELHEGAVLGEQRIQTAVSGKFGWPDGAAADVYVVNAEGQRLKNANVKEVSDNGKRLYEIRMPSDHFAILVRK